tara:strand:- start:3297 stop:3416 length:120 start_codon:yes stop_codon:yes gene_type:complete
MNAKTTYLLSHRKKDETEILNSSFTVVSNKIKRKKPGAK